MEKQHVRRRRKGPGRIRPFLIPLSKLQLPKGVRAPSPQHIYSNKGECAKLFDDLMSHEEVSKPTNGPIHELHNTQVFSAIKVLGDLPELYDWIYAEFPQAYNRAGGDFGRLSIVRFFEPGKRAEKNPKYLRKQPETHFTEKPVKYSYPDGLIMPLVWGLRALMDAADGKVIWRLDPRVFLRQNFDAIARSYRLVLEMSRFDPQKIGKSDNSYMFAEGEFEKALLKQDAAVA